MYRWRLAARRAHRLPSLARFERHESAAALAGWGRRPVASVATIIPTYRRPEQLVEAVESALAQTMDDLVVVVIDDGAGLPRLPDDERLFAYSLSRNCGVAGVVRNVGIRLVRLPLPGVPRRRQRLDAEPSRGGAGGPRPRRGADLQRARPGPGVTGPPATCCRCRSIATGCGRRACPTPTRSSCAACARCASPGCRCAHGDFPLEDWELVYRLSRRLRTEHLPVSTARYLVHDESFFTDWEASARSEVRPAAARTGSPAEAAG